MNLDQFFGISSNCGTPTKILESINEIKDGRSVFNLVKANKEIILFQYVDDKLQQKQLTRKKKTNPNEKKRKSNFGLINGILFKCENSMLYLIEYLKVLWFDSKISAVDQD